MIKANLITKEELLKLFEENEWDGLLKQLEIKIKSLGDRNLKVDISMTRSRYNQLKHNTNLGLLRADEIDVEFAKLRRIFLYLIEQAFGNNSEIPAVLKMDRKRRKQRITGILVLIMMGGILLSFGISSMVSSIEETFTYTFYVTGKNTHKCLVPGEILTVFLEGQPHPTKIDDNCRVVVNTIAAKFRSKRIPVTLGLKAKGYELIKPDTQYVLVGEYDFVRIKRDDSLGWVHGKVWRKDKKGFFEGARIEIKSRGKSWATESDSLGNFVFYIPDEYQNQEYELVVILRDEIQQLSYHPPNPQGVEIMASKEN